MQQIEKPLLILFCREMHGRRAFGSLRRCCDKNRRSQHERHKCLKAYLLHILIRPGSNYITSSGLRLILFERVLVYEGLDCRTLQPVGQPSLSR